MLKIFCVKIFRVKIFSYEEPCYEHFLHKNIYFVCFIFVVAQAYENILTTKISPFTGYNYVLVMSCP